MYFTSHCSSQASQATSSIELLRRRRFVVVWRFLTFAHVYIFYCVGFFLLAHLSENLFVIFIVSRTKIASMSWIGASKSERVLCCVFDPFLHNFFIFRESRTVVSFLMQSTSRRHRSKIPRSTLEELGIFITSIKSA